MKRVVILDLESTGLDKTKDHIIQFGAIKMEGNKLIGELDLKIRPEGNFAITPQAYMKHGVTAKDLESCPTLREVASQIIEFLETPETVAIVTYNGTSFDIPFLVNELQSIGIDFTFTKYDCYDVFLEEKRRNGITLEQTYARYKGKTMEEAGLVAHDALSDVKATYSIFAAQQRIEGYPPITMFGNDNVLSLMEFRNNIEPCFTIGKYRGLSLNFVKVYDPGYLSWCISDKCNFSDETKRYISENMN